MNKKFKRATALALTGVMMLSVAGCGSNVGDRVMKDYKVGGISEGLMTNQSINATDEELKSIVYNFVTGNITIDPAKLITPTEAELDMIKSKMADIISALKGQTNNSISDAMLNYMLWEFTKTQSKWQSVDFNVLGIDPATRKVFVDASFATTDEYKADMPASSITNGNPLGTVIKTERQQALFDYYNALYNEEMNSSGSGNIWGGTTDSENIRDESEKQSETALKKFEDTYGSLEALFLEQQELSIVQRIRHAIQVRDVAVGTEFATTEDRDKFELVIANANISKTDELPRNALKYIQSDGVGMYTYTGMAADTDFDNTGTMTFRFILDFNFNLGTGNTLDVSSVYLNKYVRGSLDGTDDNWKDTVARFPFTVSDVSSTEVIKPYVDRVINSYQKAMEESDYEALYNLFGFDRTVDEYSDETLVAKARFSDWDKYYTDQNTYCYVDYDNYDFQIVGWEQNEAEQTVLKVLVKRSKKIRGKGTYMTLPTYEEQAVLTMIVDNDKVYIDHETVLNTTMVGEPVSQVKDVSGIADRISYDEKSFTVKNEIGVLEALKKFSKAQLTYANDSATAIPDDILVLGMDNSEYDAIKQTMSLDTYVFDETTNAYVVKNPRSASEKIMWLGTWVQKSNMYCKVRVREYFIGTDGKDIDTEAYISLVNRNDVWYITDYERVVDTQLGATKVSDKNCLTHDFTGQNSTSDYKMPTEDSTVGTGIVVEDTENSAIATETRFTLEDIYLSGPIDVDTSDVGSDSTTTTEDAETEENSGAADGEYGVRDDDGDDVEYADPSDEEEENSNTSGGIDFSW